MHLIKRAGTLAVMAFGVMIAGRATAKAVPACSVSAIAAIAPKGSTITSAAPAITGSVSYCQVAASISTNPQLNDVINYEVGLPDPSVWNSRFVFVGNGVFAGLLPTVAGTTYYFTALQDDYAVAGTDTGHQSTDITDASWALGNTTAIQDYDYLAVHQVTQAAQSLIASYYGSRIQDSYFDGCSTGGRQGIVEAEDYPADFNGIVAGDPAISDFPLGFNWNEQATLAPGGQPPPSAVNLVDQAVVKQCGDPTGPAAGLVLDPPACNFQVASLECPAGKSPPGCLTAAQVATFEAIYQGATAGGVQYYPGYSVSDPADGGTNDGGWSTAIFGCTETSCPAPQPGSSEPWGVANNGEPIGPIQWVVQDGYLKYFVFENASFDTLTLSFANVNALDDVDDVTSVNGSDGSNVQGLNKFANLGHKLIVYHGWSDPVLSPYVSQNFYTSAQSVLGANMSDSVRLFMVPGMHHCTGGPGPNTFDMLPAVRSWVEQGTAPDAIIATHYQNNNPNNPVQRTMPLCSWPELPTYNGSGSYMLASSWSCVAP